MTLTDAMQVIALYKSNATYGDSKYQAWADVDGDGQITMADALAVVDAYKNHPEYNQ